MSTYRMSAEHWRALDALGSDQRSDPIRPPRARRRGTRALTMSLGLAVAAAGVATSGALLATRRDGPVGGVARLSSLETNVDASVVDVTSTLGDEGAVSAGTGIVLTSSGLVLTNNHVVDGATSVSVRDVGTGASYPARVVGYDVGRDVAVLQLEGASGLPVATVDVEPPTVGERVTAVGNAGGVGGTPSTATGSVVAVARSITAADAAAGTVELLHGMVETSATLEPGDSGGPLVNASGEVVAMDTAAASAGGVEEAAAGFAIPIGEALSIARSIATSTGVPGVHVGATPFLGVHVTTGDRGGALVVGTIAGSTAAAARVAAGDTITAVSGRAVSSATGLGAVLGTYLPGDRVTIAWTDPSGARRTASVTLGAGPTA